VDTRIISSSFQVTLLYRVERRVSWKKFEEGLVLKILSEGQDSTQRWFGAPAIGFNPSTVGEYEPDVVLGLFESIPGTLEDRLSGILRKILRAI